MSRKAACAARFLSSFLGRGRVFYFSIFISTVPESAPSWQMARSNFATTSPTVFHRRPAASSGQIAGAQSAQCGPVLAGAGLCGRACCASCLYAWYMGIVHWASYLKIGRLCRRAKLVEGLVLRACLCSRARFPGYWLRTSTDSRSERNSAARL